VANLRQARKQIYGVIIGLLVIDVVALVVLLTPIAGNTAARQAEFDSVRRQLQQKMQTVIPPDQVQSRVDQARTQIDAFYKERLATGASALTAELGRLSSTAGVRLLSAKYDELDSDLPGVTHVRVAANITGDYLAAVKFINAAERDKMFFIVETVNLAEQQGGNVRLAVTLETYLKGGVE
jgi:type IV pilus assembly protein PilO